MAERLTTSLTIKEEPLDPVEDEEPLPLDPVVTVEVKQEPLDDFGDGQRQVLEVPAAIAKEENEGLRCPKCGIAYSSKLSIKNHIQVCKTANTKISAIEAMDKPYVNKVVRKPGGLFIKGVRKITDDERNSIRILEKSCFVNDVIAAAVATPYELFCAECDDDFGGDSTAFARHLYAHTFIKREDFEQPCICSVCGEEYVNGDEIQIHFAKAKCGGKSKILFPCGFCHKTFTRKDNLRADIRCHVLGEESPQKKNYTCRFCQRQYGGISMLQIHERIHTGIDPLSLDGIRIPKVVETYQARKSKKKGDILESPINEKRKYLVKSIKQEK